MKKSVKYVGIIIILSLILSSIGIFLSGCEKKESKAIIILPGAMASALVDKSNGELVWDPLNCGLAFSDLTDDNGNISLTGTTLTVIMDKLDIIVDTIDEPDSFVNKLALDENGNPLNANVVPVDMSYETNAKYGIFGAYQEMYESFNEKYGEEYDVTVFQYDWRLSSAYNGEKLEEYINTKGYDSVILVGHSMGGMVSSNYLNRSQANRDKVEMFLSIATPFLGSVKAVRALEDATQLMDTLPAFLLDMLSGLINQIFAPLVRDSAAAYQLLPSEALLDCPSYAETSYFINNGVEGTFDEMISYIGANSWTKLTNLEVKPNFSSLEAYQNSLYTNGAHITTLANTYYFVGIGASTEESVEVTNGVISKVNYNLSGDSIVTQYSASCGLALDNDRVFTYTALHMDIGTRFNTFIRDDCFMLIDALNSPKNGANKNN